MSQHNRHYRGDGRSRELNVQGSKSRGSEQSPNILQHSPEFVPTGKAIAYDSQGRIRVERPEERKAAFKQERKARKDELNKDYQQDKKETEVYFNLQTEWLTKQIDRLPAAQRQEKASLQTELNELPAKKESALTRLKKRYEEQYETMKANLKDKQERRVEEFAPINTLARGGGVPEYQEGDYENRLSVTPPQSLYGEDW